MKAVLIITALCLIGVIWLLIKGLRGAKEVNDDNELLTQGEIDIYMNREKDKHLKDLVDRLGRKMVAKQSIEEIIAMPDKKKASQMLIDRSENKREFTNRSNELEEDLHFMSHIQG